MVSTELITRIPDRLDSSKKKVEKIRDFAKKRGYIKPVTLSSDHNGRMTLLVGEATLVACQEEKIRNIPAVVVQTHGIADDLIFALQCLELEDSPNTITVSAAIVQLIDRYGVTRKHIAESLGKSFAWINKMESLSRSLNEKVQRLVAEGTLVSRSAQEIARLPDDVQLTFAASVSNEFLSKEDVIYLVNRYLNKDVGDEERNRIIRTPKLVLPNERKHRNRMNKDTSDSMRLAHAIARCMDDATYLSRLLNRIQWEEVVVYPCDIRMLMDCLRALLTQIQTVFTRVKTESMGEKQNPETNDLIQHTKG